MPTPLFDYVKQYVLQNKLMFSSYSIQRIVIFNFLKNKQAIHYFLQFIRCSCTGYQALQFKHNIVIDDALCHFYDNHMRNLQSR